MNTIQFAYLVLIVAPFGNLIHELGHMIGAITMRADQVTVSIGRGKRIYQLNYKNVEINCGWLLFISGLTASTREKPYKSYEKIFITILGPLFNGVLVVIFLLLYQLLPNMYIFLFLLYNSWLFIMNIIPFKIGKQESDGYILLKEIFRKMYTNR